MHRTWHGQGGVDHLNPSAVRLISSLLGLGMKRTVLSQALLETQLEALVSCLPHA